MQAGYSKSSRPLNKSYQMALIRGEGDSLTLRFSDGRSRAMVPYLSGLVYEVKGDIEHCKPRPPL